MQLAAMEPVFVEHVRVVVPAAGAPHEVERMPDGRTAIVVRTLADGRADAWVMGPRTRALFKTVTGVARAVILELRPGWAAAVLGVSADALTDRHVELHDLWPSDGARVRDDLIEVTEPAVILDRMTRMIAARGRRVRETAAARLAARAVDLLEDSRERCDRVELLADELGVTARHLRRVFRESVGVSPKEFARCVRFRRAMERGRAGDWGRVAVDVGYYDQAHLIGDFRELVGVTPGAFARRAVARKPC